MEEKTRQVTCPACHGRKGLPPDEPCERCDALGKVDARTLEAIAGDMRREVNAAKAAEMKGKRLESQLAEVEAEQLEHGTKVKQLQTELVYTLEDEVPA